jgi:hypothetical protein
VIVSVLARAQTYISPRLPMSQVVGIEAATDVEPELTQEPAEFSV